MASLIPVVLAGLLTGFGLIVVIGAQNAYVLRLGITGPQRAVAAVVAVCAISDVLLIAAGVLGIGVVVERLPVLLVVLRFVGAAFLLVYGAFAVRRAIRPRAMRVEVAAPGTPTTPGGAGGVAVAVAPTRLAAAVLPALAFTWLNPHVYLDTLVFLGSIANQQGDDRWWWAGGAMAASCIWFAALGFGARVLRPVFARPMAWRVLDIGIAVVMIGLGLKVAILG